MSFRIIATIAVLLVTSLVALGQEAAAKAEKKDWTQLFNGRDLNDWTVKITKHKLGENFGDTFRVEDCKDKKAKNFKTYYVKSDNTKCVY